MVLLRISNIVSQHIKTPLPPQRSQKKHSMYWHKSSKIFFNLNLNYSRSSIWTGNCTMNPKIDPCSLNIAQPISKKGIKSLWQSSVRLLSCQGSLIVTIPAVHSAYRYLKVSHRIHFYKGSCYTAWMWYILLNELLLQQSSAVLSGRYGLQFLIVHQLCDCVSGSLITIFSYCSSMFCI